MVVGRRGEEARGFQGRERVQQQGCLVASPLPRLRPVSMCVGTAFCASTQEGVHRDESSSLSISPFFPGSQNRTYGTSLRRRPTGGRL